MTWQTTIVQNVDKANIIANVEQTGSITPVPVGPTTKMFIVANVIRRSTGYLQPMKKTPKKSKPKTKSCDGYDSGYPPMSSRYDKLVTPEQGAYPARLPIQPKPKK